MKKLKESTLFSLIHDYLKIYLPNHRNLSPNTIKSYSKSLSLLVDFVKRQRNIPLHDVTFEMLTSDIITAFLDSLEAERGCSVSTRNNRLASIRAFIKYTSGRDVTTVAVAIELKKVSVKKPNKAEAIEYMSMDAITAIVNQADISKPKGLRDATFMILMYDLGARIEEMVQLKVSDLHFGKAPITTLLGKGGKIRSVPMMERTTQYLRMYLDHFHPNEPLLSDRPLFYAIIHGEVKHLTDRRMRYALKAYGEKARKVCLDVPENVYPHMFRHSRAMHLYQNGMDLTLVSQWLGHANLETTRIYAHADTEHKRTAIAKATPENNPLHVKLNPARFIITDEEALKRLTGLV